MTLTLQYRGEDGKWHQDLNPHDFLGQQVENILAIAEGRDVVAKLETTDSRHYLCGTEGLVKYYRGKGCEAQTFKDWYESNPECHGKRPYVLEGVVVWG